MESPIRSSGLHRLVKLMMDSGEAESVAEAQRILERYRLGIHVSNGITTSPAYQAALLTAVNTGRRCFLGGVLVLGNLDVPLTVPWRHCSTLAEAVTDLQGQIVSQPKAGLPRILFGNQAPYDDKCEFSVLPVVQGWNGGVVPEGDLVSPSYEETFTPAGVLAGALAVSEAFQFVRGDNTLAGHRPMGFSLWKPNPNNSWLDADPGPALKNLPAKLWLIGLGHLGQAYLWTLGLLPYPAKSDIRLVLQDIDALEEANDSTSLLTDRSMVGIKKTRAMAAWCEQRGFQTTLIERRFADNFKIDDTEPALALCGVDNIEARKDLEKVGFKRIVEAGLGKGSQEYLGLQIHTFPAGRAAEQSWTKRVEDPGADNPIEILIRQQAYQKLHENGVDRCGLIELAGHSVGAPFVGAIASTLVIAQVLRLLESNSIDELIDGDLRSSSILNYVIPNRSQSTLFNPGLIRI